MTTKKKAKVINRSVSVVLPVTLIADIAAEAERQKRKLSQMLRILIEERFEQMFDPGTPVR